MLKGLVDPWEVLLAGRESSARFQPSETITSCTLADVATQSAMANVCPRLHVGHHLFGWSSHFVRTDGIGNSGQSDAPTTDGHVCASNSNGPMRLLTAFQSGGGGGSVAAVEFGGAQACSSVIREDRGVSPDLVPFRRRREEVRSDMEFWKDVRREVLTGQLSKRAACRKYGSGLAHAQEDPHP